MNPIILYSDRGGPRIPALHTYPPSSIESYEVTVLLYFVVLMYYVPT